MGVYFDLGKLHKREAGLKKASKLGIIYLFYKKGLIQTQLL